MCDQLNECLFYQVQCPPDTIRRVYSLLASSNMIKSAVSDVSVSLDPVVAPLPSYSIECGRICKNKHGFKIQQAGMTSRLSGPCLLPLV